MVKKKLLLKKKENVIWLNHNREGLHRSFSGFGEIDKSVLHTTSNSVTSTKRSRPSPVFHKDARFQAKRIQRTLTRSQTQTVSSVSCQVPQSRLHNVGIKMKIWSTKKRRRQQNVSWTSRKLCSYHMNRCNRIMKKTAWENIQNLFVFVSNNQDLNVSVLPPRPWLLVCTSVFLHFSFSSTCHQVSHLWLCKRNVLDCGQDRIVEIPSISFLFISTLLKSKSVKKKTTQKNRRNKHFFNQPCFRSSSPTSFFSVNQLRLVC